MNNKKEEKPLIYNNYDHSNAELPCLKISKSIEIPGNGLLEHWELSSKQSNLDECKIGLELLLAIYQELKKDVSKKP